MRVVFESDELPEFTANSWLKYTPTTQPEAFKPAGPHPPWFDALPTRPGDVIRDRADGTMLLVRGGGQTVTLYFDDQGAGSSKELLSILTKYPWRDELPVLGPPRATGVREWP